MEVSETRGLSPNCDWWVDWWVDPYQWHSLFPDKATLAVCMPVEIACELGVSPCGGYLGRCSLQDSLHMIEVWWTRCQMRRNQLQHLSKWCRTPNIFQSNPSGFPIWTNFDIFWQFLTHIQMIPDGSMQRLDSRSLPISSLAGEIPGNRGLRLWSILGSETLQLGCEDENSEAPRALVKGHGWQDLGCHMLKICWDSWCWNMLSRHQVMSGTDQLLTVAEHFKPVFEKTIEVAVAVDAVWGQMEHL